jgi:flagellar FliJ protein
VNHGKIGKVAAVAKIDERRSGRELGAILQSHQQKQAQLEQLIQFKADYETTLCSAGGKGIAARQLQDYRLFLHKLSDAVDQQVKQVEDSQLKLDEVRTQWLSKSQRTSALDTIVDEQNKAAKAARNKAAQKESDENTLARRLLLGDH